MDTAHDDRPVAQSLVAWSRAAVSIVMVLTTLNWIGWGLGVQLLIRVLDEWPQMVPWTALWLSALAVAVWLQLRDSSTWSPTVARALAAFVAVTTCTVLAEYMTGMSWALDSIWFTKSLRAIPDAMWAGRPSPQTAIAVLLFAMAIGVMRMDARRFRTVWLVGVVGGAIIPLASTTAYLFNATTLVSINASTGQAISTAVCLLLLASATASARPDRLPLRWLLRRPDRPSLVRLLLVLSGFPIVVAICRSVLHGGGADEHAVWAVSILAATAGVGALTFYVSQRQQSLLMATELQRKLLTDTEHRYRMLAQNAVDVILHLRGYEIAWVSPSVEVAFGDPVNEWRGADFRELIHPDDVDAVVALNDRISDGELVLQRFRVGSARGDHHWVDVRGKQCVGDDGGIDGAIFALRLVDDQVAAEQRLDRLARFDVLTGLMNRAETIERLRLALAEVRPGTTRVGILFCDVDGFKAINDTWGHPAGDVVLTTLAGRILDCVGPLDMVGRTGGDEITVVLPGIGGADDAAVVAETIRQRAAEPIHFADNTIHTTLSVGAAVAESGEDVDSLIARADSAMYRAKLGR